MPSGEVARLQGAFSLRLEVENSQACFFPHVYPMGLRTSTRPESLFDFRSPTDDGDVISGFLGQPPKFGQTSSSHLLPLERCVGLRRMRKRRQVTGKDEPGAPGRETLVCGETQLLPPQITPIHPFLGLSAFARAVGVCSVTQWCPFFLFLGGSPLNSHLPFWIAPTGQGC